MYEEIKQSSAAAITELLDSAKLKPGSLVVVGCSSSEILGQNIGKGSSPEAAKAVVDTILPILADRQILLAAQCCEHLNRALIVERSTMEKFGFEQVTVLKREILESGGYRNLA